MLSEWRADSFTIFIVPLLLFTLHTPNPCKVSLILGVREIQKDLKKNTLMQLKKKNLKYIQPLFMKIFSVVLFTMMKKLETI